MKKSIFSLALIFGTFVLVVSSCKKDETDSIDSNTTSAVDNALAEASYDDVFRRIDEESSSNSNLNSRQSNNDRQVFQSAGCADSVVITSSNGGFPKTMTLYFSNVICSDGRLRNGNIISVFSGKYRDAGTIISTHFQNYSIDGNEIHGLKTITNNGLNANNHINFTIQVDTARIITSSGTIQWSSTRNREWVAGSSTPLIMLDDEYSITGNGNGINRKGDTFSLNILSALSIKLACKYITQGVVEFSNGTRSIQIDYGNGACDDDAIVTIRGKSYPIKLK